MSILRDVVAELFGMFVGDMRLTLAILLVVAATAVLLGPAHLAPLVGAAVLTLGCIAVVVEAAFREARRRRR